MHNLVYYQRKKIIEEHIIICKTNVILRHLLLRGMEETLSNTYNFRVGELPEGCLRHTQKVMRKEHDIANRMLTLCYILQ